MLFSCEDGHGWGILVMFCDERTVSKRDSEARVALPSRVLRWRPRTYAHQMPNALRLHLFHTDAGPSLAEVTGPLLSQKKKKGILQILGV